MTNYAGRVRAALGGEGLGVVHKFGYSAAVVVTSYPIWDKGGAYVYPAVATAMTVSSGNAVDTIAGAGARTVQVEGLDANYNVFVSEPLEMDGQNPVAIPTDLIRVFRIVVLTSGSAVGDANTGVIYVGAGAVASGVPATVYAQVTAGEGQTLMSMYTVPKGFTGLLYNWRSSTGRLDDALVKLYKRPFGGCFRVQDISPTFEGSDINLEEIPIKIAEKTDIEARAQSSSGTIAVGYRFSLGLVPNVD